MFSTARTVAGASLVLTYTPIDSDGEPSSADPGTVTIGVVRSDGTTVVAAGTATTGTGTTPRTYTLAASATTQVDELTATWKVSTTTVHETTIDVVGGVYATTAEIRGTEGSLSDVTKNPAAKLIRARNEVEAMVERACKQVLAFVPRFDVVTVDHFGGCALVVPHYFVRAVRWATYTDSSGTAQSIDLTSGVTIDGDAGLLWLNDSTWPAKRIRIGYEHGMPAPPADLKRQAIAAIRRYANQANSAIDPRAMSQTLQGGEILRFPTPGLGQWVTGIPEIDEVLKSYRTRYPAAAVA